MWCWQDGAWEEAGGQAVRRALPWSCWTQGVSLRSEQMPAIETFLLWFQFSFPSLHAAAVKMIFCVKKSVSRPYI